MNTILAIYSFVVGLAFGSFALAMVDRMKAKKTWIHGRSKCDHCKHVLSPRDLIPVFSWVIQGGKCQYCKKKLSSYYPLVELGSGFVFLFSYLFLPYEIEGLFSVMFGLWLFSLVLMTALTVFDLRWYRLPNKIVYPLISVALIHRVVEFFAKDETLSEALLPTLLALIVGSGVFWLLFQISKGKWIGDGDYRLGVAIGLFLADPLVTWLAIFIASLIGLVFMLPSILGSKKNKLKLKVPFGPFLILGLYFCYLFGEKIIDWYLETFLFL